MTIMNCYLVPTPTGSLYFYRLSKFGKFGASQFLWFWPGRLLTLLLTVCHCTLGIIYLTLQSLSDICEL